MRQKLLYQQMLASPQLGGAEIVAMEIHRHVTDIQDGNVSRLVLPHSGGTEEQARAQKFSYASYDFDKLTSSQRIVSAFENLRIWHNVSQGRGLIHVHSPFVYGASRLALNLSRLKTILHIHLDYSADSLIWSLKSPPDAVFVCSRFVRPAVEEALDALGRMRPPIHVLSNAIDTRRFLPGDRPAAKENLGFRTEIPLLLVVANLSPHKGQETAIRAVADLQSIGHQVHLLLAGAEREPGGAYRQHLMDLCSSLGIQTQVEFAGFRSDVPALLQAADFVLLPSTSEGLPLVLLEAQASKAIVMAAPVAGVPEIISDGVTGFLIDASDHLTYAETIRMLLADPDKARSITETASKQVRNNHDIRSYCSNVASIYQDLLS